jgi:AcrR family transcriptional regulator
VAGVKQAERRAATRARLLDAAMACLLEQGHLGFRTADVVRRAGSSQGALFDHFPTKQALLGATVEHLFDALRDEYEHRFAQLPPSQRTARGGLRLLWDVFGDERLRAAYELYTAARTDPELRAALEPVVTAHGERIQELARELLGEAAAADPERFRAGVELAVLAMEGLVLERMARPVPGADRRLLTLLDELTTLIFDLPAPVPTGAL